MSIFKQQSKLDKYVMQILECWESVERYYGAPALEFIYVLDFYKKTENVCIFKINWMNWCIACIHERVIVLAMHCCLNFMIIDHFYHVVHIFTA